MAYKKCENLPTYLCTFMLTLVGNTSMVTFIAIWLCSCVCCGYRGQYVNTLYYGHYWLCICLVAKLTRVLIFTIVTYVSVVINASMTHYFGKFGYQFYHVSNAS